MEKKSGVVKPLRNIWAQREKYWLEHKFCEVDLPKKSSVFYVNPINFSS